MNGSFVSGLAGHIYSMLELKHAIGLPYDTSERHLRSFDAMCAQNHPGQTTLTAEMGKEWVLARPGEHVNSQVRRITPVRQLGKLMIGLGVDAYVIPPGIPGKQIRYRPHIFSPGQLRAIFDAADAIRPTPYGGQRHLIIPAIFRMLYCLGLRPGEAIRLHRNDVDLGRGAVRVRESKGHKDRLVFMSNDLHEYCRGFDAAISAQHENRVAFFPNRSGSFYSLSTLSRWFGELLASAGPAVVATPGSAPRPYDLRHAHVVETINRWARAGQDPLEHLAYLSMHLGHTSPEHTLYYFHLAADFHPDLRRLANTGIESDLAEASHALR